MLRVCKNIQAQVLLKSSGYVISQMNIWGNKNELKLCSITPRIQDVFWVLMRYFSKATQMQTATIGHYTRYNNTGNYFD